jgi:hypothetical protein
MMGVINRYLHHQHHQHQLHNQDLEYAQLVATTTTTTTTTTNAQFQLPGISRNAATVTNASAWYSACLSGWTINFYHIHGGAK